MRRAATPEADTAPESPQFPPVPHSLRCEGRAGIRWVGVEPVSPYDPFPRNPIHAGRRRFRIEGG